MDQGRASDDTRHDSRDQHGRSRASTGTGPDVAPARRGDVAAGRAGEVRRTTAQRPASYLPCPAQGGHGGAVGTGVNEARIERKSWLDALEVVTNSDLC